VHTAVPAAPLTWTRVMPSGLLTIMSDPAARPDLKGGHNAAGLPASDA